MRVAVAVVACTITAAVAAEARAATASQRKQNSEASTADQGDKIWWSDAVVVEPGALTLGLDSAPGIEYQHPLSHDRKHAHSLAVAYWGQTFTNANSAEGATGDEVVHHKDKLSIQALVGRYMLYLTPSFHFNFGLGVRETSTQERADLAGGGGYNLTKSATSLGGDLGLGNRWVLGNGLILGGTWFQLFLPVAVLASHDATLPTGYTAGSCGVASSSACGSNVSSRRNDGMKGSLRIAADLGYAW